jgi:pimeloyl-ACP methyl ester carboxylesterase
MNSFLTIFLSAVSAICVLGAALSLRFTRRPEPDPPEDPSDYGMDHETVVLTTQDGLRLRGWLIPGGDGARAVVFLHGHGGSMDPDLKYAPAFHEAGISVLMFDFRAHGRSEGQVVSMGYLERRDAVAAVRFLESRGFERLGLLGFSMGGVVAILTAPGFESVRAVVVDGVFGRITEPIVGWGARRGLPAWLGRFLGWLTVATTSLRLRVNLFREQPIHWAGKMRAPVFIIHAAEDRYVSWDHLQELIAATPGPKEVWLAEGAGHREVDQRFPQEYLKRVLGFFERCL